MKGVARMENLDVIKSVRVFVENGIIKLDFRVHKGVKLPKGRTDNRFRCSTGRDGSKMSLKYVEQKKYELARKHYDSLFDNYENKVELLFIDIAYIALEETAVYRRKQDGSKDYLNILEKDVLPKFGNMALKEIKVSDIKAWQVEMGKGKISQSRFNKKYYVVKRVLDYAIENGYIGSNPISLVKRSSKLFIKAKSNNSKYFTAEEVEKILSDRFEGANDKEKLSHAFLVAFLHVAFLTGARTGEIMALKWEDIDFSTKTITIRRSIRKGIISVTKTDTERVVPMVHRLIDALLKWKDNTHREYVFPVPNKGTPYSEPRSIVDSKFKPMLERLGIPYKILYCTRATFASIAVEKGISIPIVSTCLGHGNIATTQRYYIRMGNIDTENTRIELEKMAM
ncbi:tyrosine-type recombinase/integrase [Sulfuricurvum kujiense]|nr:site-specific integrase [Sulfuricurvum kujiense]